MSKVRILFHSANPMFEEMLRRFAKGLDRYVVRFAPRAMDSSIDDSAINFVFCSLVGNTDEIQCGLKMMTFAQDNIRVFGKRVPMAVATNLAGFLVWKSIDVEPSSIRLIVRIGEPSSFPDTNSLICPRAKRVDVLNTNWTEDDLARVRAGLVGATSPFSYGGM